MVAEWMMALPSSLRVLKLYLNSTFSDIYANAILTVTRVRAPGWRCLHEWNEPFDLPVKVGAALTALFASFDVSRDLDVNASWRRMNIIDGDYTGDAVTYFNKIRTAAKLPAMRANDSDGKWTAGSRATDAGYKWTKTSITMGVGYANVDAYLKTMNKDNNRWIVDKDIVDIGAMWARYMPDGQFYYDVCYGAPAK
ncbi:hypothetical protein GGF32_009563 [Allomyces javanicus]|nr:hypothetical protein GGF32_009563 [Allomyces javanicus]